MNEYEMQTFWKEKLLIHDVHFSEEPTPAEYISAIQDSHKIAVKDFKAVKIVKSKTFWLDLELPDNVRILRTEISYISE